MTDVARQTELDHGSNCCRLQKHHKSSHEQRSASIEMPTATSRWEGGRRWSYRHCRDTGGGGETKQKKWVGEARFFILVTDLPSERRVNAPDT